MNSGSESEDSTREEKIRVKTAVTYEPDDLSTGNFYFLFQKNQTLVLISAHSVSSFLCFYQLASSSYSKNLDLDEIKKNSIVLSDIPKKKVENMEKIKSKRKYRLKTKAKLQRRNEKQEFKVEEQIKDYPLDEKSKFFILKKANIGIYITFFCVIQLWFAPACVSVQNRTVTNISTVLRRSNITWSPFIRLSVANIDLYVWKIFLNWD